MTENIPQAEQEQFDREFNERVPEHARVQVRNRLAVISAIIAGAPENAIPYLEDEVELAIKQVRAKSGKGVR